MEEKLNSPGQAKKEVPKVRNAISFESKANEVIKLKKLFCSVEENWKRGSRGGRWSGGLGSQWLSRYFLCVWVGVCGGWWRVWCRHAWTLPRVLPVCSHFSLVCGVCSLVLRCLKRQGPKDHGHLNESISQASVRSHCIGDHGIIFTRRQACIATG